MPNNDDVRFAMDVNKGSIYDKYMGKVYLLAIVDRVVCLDVIIQPRYDSSLPDAGAEYMTIATFDGARTNELLDKHFDWAFDRIRVMDFDVEEEEDESE